MKKLSFILGIFAIGSLGSFAQSNIGIVTESGADQEATIDQMGFLNKSYVTQSNKANEAEVTQSNFNALYNTYSDVNQSGKSNEAVVKQISNGTLTGANAIGTLKALVTQTGNKNEVYQYQGPHNQQGISFAEVIQSGNENFASQNQLKYGNEARINQSGNNNVAMQAQDCELLPDEEGSYGTALIDQSGNSNTATQKQDGWSNDAKAYQSGNGNLSTQVQEDYSWKSIAFVSQSGNNNIATQNQLGYLNSATIDQASNNSVATQIQTSGHKRTVDYEELNEAEIYQWGGTKNTALQTQESLGLSLMENEGIIWQNGSLNDATQTQTGGDNFSTVSQTGNNHKATVTQSMSIVQL